jgi:hypothetical protein
LVALTASTCPNAVNTWFSDSLSLDFLILVFRLFMYSCMQQVAAGCTGRQIEDESRLACSYVNLSVVCCELLLVEHTPAGGPRRGSSLPSAGGGACRAAGAPSVCKQRPAPVGRALGSPPCRSRRGRRPGHRDIASLGCCCDVRRLRIPQAMYSGALYCLWYARSPSRAERAVVEAVTLSSRSKVSSLMSCKRLAGKLTVWLGGTAATPASEPAADAELAAAAASAMVPAGRMRRAGPVASCRRFNRGCALAQYVQGCRREDKQKETAKAT